MTEQTNPEGGVEQAVSDIDRVTAFLDRQPAGQAEEEQPPQPAAEPQQPEGSQAEAEPTPDDILDDEPVAQPTEGTVFEIVHAGKTHTVADRAEQIRLMQQGFDYTQKTQGLASQQRQVQEQLQKLAQVEQVIPQLQGKLAEVKTLESQLSQFQNVNWVQEAQADPGRYAQLRAHYDTLRDAYGRVLNDYQRTEGAVRQHVDSIKAQRLQAEAQRLPELVPEWKDQAKLESAKADIGRHYESAYGIKSQDLNAEVDSAFKVAVLYKAMKYDQLVKSKADKSKTLRTVPPVPRPGASQTPDAQRADRTKEMSQRLRKTGDAKDAAALLLQMGIVK